MALYVYMTIMLILFAFIAIIYNALDYALDTMNPEVRDWLGNSTNDTIATYSINTRSTMRTIWDYWPVFLFIVVLFWGIVAVQREDKYGG